MKILISLLTASTLFFSQALFAANTDCAAVAGEAAFRLARPQGNKVGSSLFVSVGNTRLVKKAGSSLLYNIEIAYDIGGGYSDSFPTEIYSVVAVGTEMSCKLISVKLVK